MSEPTILFGADNNVATQVKPCKPWEFVPEVPASALVDKNHYRQWRCQKDTKHLVFTGFEGLNPAIRVNSETNPVKRLHALVVDYDSNINDNAFETVLERCPSDLRPTWIARSPSGMGARLVYMLEAPGAVDCEPILNKFLDVAKENLQLEKILPGLDKAAWSNVSTFYDVGTQWKRLGDNFLSTSVINYWLAEAIKKANWSKFGEVEIPLDVIADEIASRGWTWPGEFVENARGPVFWEGGQNPTSCIVTPNGMHCFSRDRGFFTWAFIFGGGFVKQFVANKIGGAIDGTWFDGKQYYRKFSGRWKTMAKEDFTKFLKVRRNLSDEKRGDTCSEVNRAEIDVQELNRVDGAVPALFDPRDLIERDGQRFLNISYVTPIQPAKEPGEWGENFPWISSFLDTFFDPPEQLPYMLAWIKRFYSGAVQGSLTRGHNPFIVGPSTSGKTLLGLRIIGALVGGSIDASDVVVKGSDFNKHLSEKALWRIDDGQATADAVTRRKFSEFVKKIAANPNFTFRKMYADPVNNEWSGRLYVTLNDDAYSLQMLPDLSMSLEDKIMVFKCAARPFDYFPPAHVLEPMIAVELPHFARWLLEYSPPAHVVGNNRFGVKSYIHEGLRDAAMHSGQTGDILGLVEAWIKRCRPIDTFGKTWSGTASDWWTEVAKDDVLKSLIQKYTFRQLGMKFVEASHIDGSRIRVLPKTKHGLKYEIYLNGDDSVPSKVRSFDPIEN